MKLLSVSNKYKDFRWFMTSDGVMVVGGKSDGQNEEVMKNFVRPEYTIMHTALPGSPFMIIQSGEPSKTDLEESAIFTGCFSQQWKLNPKKIEIDVFKGENIYKSRGMKLGTFGVKGDKTTKVIKPELAIVIQMGKLKAVPKTTKEKKLATIRPGKLSKEEAVNKIAGIARNKFNFPVSKEEIMQAIPSDKIDVVNAK